LVALVSLAGWRYGQWCRLIRQGRRLSDTRLLALLDGARQAMGVRRPVTLVALARLSSPAVFGFRRVRLLLPETALDLLTDQDLRLLFLHEMAHVRGQDMLLNVLLMAVQFMHWFNPLVWVGLHRLRADRELVCDAMVLQRTRPEERSGYGGLLIKLLDDFSAAQRMIPTVVPVLSSKHELKKRIVLIKHYRSASPAAWVATGLAVVALACATFTSSSQQPPAGDPGPPPTPTVGDVGVSERPAAMSNGVLWRSERVHYSFPDAKPYWAWIILPAEDWATNCGSFKSVVDSIFRSERDARIEHVCLGSAHRGTGMQKEVIDQLKDTVVLGKYPTRHGADGRMHIDGTPNPLSVQMCQLVRAAILRTRLVREMDGVLLPRGLHIGRVSTEKLCIYAEKGTFRWDAIGWLVVERAESGRRED
jgi:hypothetical protein